MLAVAVVLIANAAGVKNSDNLTLPGTDSTYAQDLLTGSLPAQAYGTNPVVMQAPEGQKVTSSKNKQAIDDTLKALRKTAGRDQGGRPLRQGRQGQRLEGQDDRLHLGDARPTARATSPRRTPTRSSTPPPPPATRAWRSRVGGYLGQAVSKSDTESSEAIGLAAAVIILLFAFGTATAMVLPIVTALIGLAISLALIKLLGHVAAVPSVAPTLGTMIGLGVGIDYALFIVTRHKLQLRDGMDIQESIARATATSGGAVVFAGTTVVIALVSLLASRIPLVGTMGYSAAVAVLVAVLAAITLLPALLGALDYRINSLRVKLGKTHPDDHQPHGWRRWATAISHRPWRSLVASAAILIVLAIPVLNLELGSSDNGELPEDTTARQAYDLLAEGFGPGINGPFLVGVKLGSPAKGDQQSSRRSTSS